MLETAVSLGKKLRTVYDNKDFVMGILATVQNEEDQNEIIDVIDRGTDVDDEVITVLAIELSRKRKMYTLHQLKEKKMSIREFDQVIMKNGKTGTLIDVSADGTKGIVESSEKTDDGYPLYNVRISD